MSIRPVEVRLVSGEVRFEDRESTGRRVLILDYNEGGYYGSVALCDIPIPGVCSGSMMPQSDMMSESDRDYLFSLKSGTVIELVIRRVCGA